MIYYWNEIDNNIIVIIFELSISYFRFSSFFDKKPGAYFPISQVSFCLLSYTNINNSSTILQYSPTCAWHYMKGHKGDYRYHYLTINTPTLEKASRPHQGIFGYGSIFSNHKVTITTIVFSSTCKCIAFSRFTHICRWWPSINIVTLRCSHKLVIADLLGAITGKLKKHGSRPLQSQILQIRVILGSSAANDRW